MVVGGAVAAGVGALLLLREPKKENTEQPTSGMPEEGNDPGVLMQGEFAGQPSLADALASKDKAAVRDALRSNEQFGSLSEIKEALDSGLAKSYQLDVRDYNAAVEHGLIDMPKTQSELHPTHKRLFAGSATEEEKARAAADNGFEESPIVWHRTNVGNKDTFGLKKTLPSVVSIDIKVTVGWCKPFPGGTTWHAEYSEDGKNWRSIGGRQPVKARINLADKNSKYRQDLRFVETGARNVRYIRIRATGAARHNLFGSDTAAEAANCDHAFKWSGSIFHNH